MNKVRVLSIFTVLTTIFLVSCDPSSKYEEELTEIDSSLMVVDTIEQKFNGIKFDSLHAMVRHVLNNEDSMRKYYNPDTLSLYIGTRMNESKGIRKSLKNIDAKKKIFNTEIQALRKQFKSLKEDIENGVLKEEKINEYLEKEKEDLNKLNISFTEFYEQQEIQKRFYYYSVPVIDSFLVDLKSEAERN